MKRSRTILAIAACALLTGCIHHHSRSHPHGMPPGQAKKLHSHGDHCGHVYIDGHWVLVDSAPGHRKHRGKGWKRRK
ncbi:MAG: hypothetical protein ACYTG5_18700 [Planctomycetota bacterium]|jgi:hypothetical protein